jgi:hypothetical protein
MPEFDSPIIAIERELQTIRDRVPHDLRRELAEPLDTIERALKQVVKEWLGDLRALRDLREKHRRKPKPETIEQDRKHWEEKQRKTWGQFYADHPGEEEAALRASFRRHDARVKHEAKRQEMLQDIQRLIDDMNRNTEQ